MRTRTLTQQNNPSLKGKCCLITGAAKRLGKALCLAVAQQGADVVIHYNQSKDDAHCLKDEIISSGSHAWIVQGDLADPVSHENIMSDAIDSAGHIDILINNASVFKSDTIMDMSTDDLLQNIMVHAIGPLNLARKFASQNIPGHIVNMLDSRVADYDKKHISYHLSKRMLSDITRILAVELAPDIAVNAVSPGLILPPEGKDDTWLQRLTNTNPMQKHGQPGDIVDAVLYLLSTSFVTGQTINVDGGRHMKGKMYD